MRGFFATGVITPIFFIFILIPCAVERFFIDILGMDGSTCFTLSGRSLFVLYGIVDSFYKVEH